MSWAVGYDENWKRDVGYGIPAICDFPGCNTRIDRGLSYVCCESEPYGGEHGCGLYFCDEHKQDYRSTDDGSDAIGPMCPRCATNSEPYEAKPDVPEWVSHKLTHPSWSKWRLRNAITPPTGDGE